MNASAPNWLAAGSQLLVKIFKPSALNHEEACWVVETAIRTRITSTSRPAPSARAAKPRSPSGRRWTRGLPADPAGTAGSAFAAMLTTTSRSDRLVSRYPPSRADLAELRLGHRGYASGNRRVAQRWQQLLAVSDQVADPRLEHLCGVRARLLL